MLAVMYIMIYIIWVTVILLYSQEDNVKVICVQGHCFLGLL